MFWIVLWQQLRTAEGRAGCLRWVVATAIVTVVATLIVIVATIATAPR